MGQRKNSESPRLTTKPPRTFEGTITKFECLYAASVIVLTSTFWAVNSVVVETGCGDEIPAQLINVEFDESDGLQAPMYDLKRRR